MLGEQLHTISEDGQQWEGGTRARMEESAEKWTLLTDYDRLVRYRAAILSEHTWQASITKDLMSRSCDRARPAAVPRDERV